MRSQNGWPASPTLKTRPLVVAGESFSPGILDDDDVFAVLQYVAVQMHERVEPIVRDDWHQADDWGFSFRENRNDPNSLSNHSSATAFDYNATRHPNGVPTRNTFTDRQIAEVHEILREVDNVVRWGGDFSGTPDSMHFEINADKAAVARVAEKLKGLEDDMFEPEDRKTLNGIDRRLNRFIEGSVNRHRRLMAALDELADETDVTKLRAGIKAIRADVAKQAEEEV
jgi:hypothetical protein